MKILNFGSCNIDFVYKLDHIVTIGETETSNSMQVFPGGKGSNQSVALAKAEMWKYIMQVVSELTEKCLQMF